MIFKLNNSQNTQVYDETYFKKLGKDLAKKSIANLRRELKECYDI